jgi:hypothetical protein
MHAAAADLALVNGLGFQAQLRLVGIVGQEDPEILELVEIDILLCRHLTDASLPVPGAPTGRAVLWFRSTAGRQAEISLTASSVVHRAFAM